MKTGLMAMTAGLAQGKYYGMYLKSWENELFKLTVTSYEPHSNLTRHYHDNSYLSILLAGQYWEQHNGENACVAPGEVLFRPGGYDHANSFLAAGGRCFNIEFKKAWHAGMDRCYDLPSTYRLYSAGQHPALYKLVYRFMRGEPGTEEIGEWLFGINGDDLRGRPLRWIDEVKRIIDKEIDLVHSIESLSKRVFVHPVYLSGAFKRRTGMTVGKYQQKMKLGYAIDLLLKTALPVSDIAVRCGFFDSAHFGHSFKSIYGVSPGKFRAAVKS